MLRRRITAAFVSGLAIAALASPVEAGDWSQLYAGAGIGVNAFTGDATVFLKPNGPVLLNAGGPFGADIGASLFLGGDYQLNRWLVVGAFASYDWSNAAIKIRIREGNDASADARVVSIEDMWTVGGRLGFLVTNATMLYGIAGYSWIKVDDMKLAFSVNGNSGSFRLPLPNSEGITFGGGVEHKLSNNVALRAEYRMTGYGRETIYEDRNISVTGRAHSHVARIAALYRLGGNPEWQDAPGSRDSWSGLHIGIGIGLAAYPRELDVRGDSPGHIGDEFRITGLGGGNVHAGITGGYDVRLASRVVGGIIASLDGAAGRHGLRLSAPGGGAFTLDLLNARHAWSLGGRLGYLFSPTLLGYVSGGYTHIQFDDATATLVSESIFRFPFPGLSGGFAGVGFEKLMTPQLSLRSEYKFSQFESYKVPFTTPAGDVARVLFEPASHAVNLSINYRFGGSGPVGP